MTFAKLGWLVVVPMLLIPSVATTPRVASAAQWQRGRNDPRGFELQASADGATAIRLRWAPQQGATEYVVYRDGIMVGSTVGALGYYTDVGLQPREHYRYNVSAKNAAGTTIAQSVTSSAKTDESTTVRTDYTVLALAYNPMHQNLTTERVYLNHRIQFLQLASLGSATIHLYKGGIVETASEPPMLPASTSIDYPTLVTRRLSAFDGLSIVDLIESGAIDHVWVVKGDGDFLENAFIGSHLIQGSGMVEPNTWTPIPVKVSRSFFLNHYGDNEKSYDAYSHMVEGIMTSITLGHPENWPRDTQYTVYTPDCPGTATTQVSLNLFERFRLTDGWNGAGPLIPGSAYASPGNSNIGSSHFPPTSARDCLDYRYYDLGTWQRYVDSAADDWLNFPVFSGIRRKLGGYDFGAMNYYPENTPAYGQALWTSPELHASFRFASASYHQWWFAHIPHNPGVSHGKLNDWWPYLFDFNRFDGSVIDYPVRGFERTGDFRFSKGEIGTDDRDAGDWGYWHSQNGFSPGGKAADLQMVGGPKDHDAASVGKRALSVTVENGEYWESLGFGRNDVFYPASRNAHWNLSRLRSVHVAIKLGDNANLVTSTNPIIRLYKNGGNRLEFVPLTNGAYTNLFLDPGLMDADGWYHFTVPVTGSASWEKNIIGYIEPSLTGSARLAARTQIERDILADVNYVEISIRTTTSQFNAPDDVVTYYIDGLVLQDR